MAQYILIATLKSESAADRFLNILIRRGLTVSPLASKQRDPIASGPHGALLVISIDTGSEDDREVNKFVREQAKGIDWISLVILRGDLHSMLWTCRAGDRSAATPAQALAIAQAASEGVPPPLGMEGFNEDEWFAQGEQYVHPEQE